MAKISFKDAQDGISNTFSIVPGALGKEGQLFVGDIEVELECSKDKACSIPNLMVGADWE